MIGAVLLERNDEWQTRHRYMQLEAMAQIDTIARRSHPETSARRSMMAARMQRRVTDWTLRLFSMAASPVPRDAALLALSVGACLALLTGYAG